MLAPVALATGASSVRRLLLTLCAAAPALAPAAAADAPAAPDPAYRAELVARAAELGLSSQPGWRQLLHMRRPPLALGPKSAVDDARFFLAAGGARDPQAELEATLTGFFDAEPVRADGQTGQCAFPARWRWLDAQLHFDAARLPRQACPAYAQAREVIGPVSVVTLVFAEAFMNNPASMFGHTLLRLDSGDSADTQLLGWAVNYSGQTGAEAGPLYAVKGIFGFYPGYYGIAPYYEKVKEYGDWESRDIWEYRLDLAAAEIEVLLEHLWELQGVAFDYYYFDENCSYQLLALLQTARAGVDLTAGYPLWVIPADTVRTVVDEAGMLTGTRWRPSAVATLRHEAGRLPRAQLALALRVAGGEVAPDGPELAALPEDERARVLSVAYDWLRHRFLSRDVTRDESAGRARAILVARSRIEVQGAPPPPPRPRVRPDEGHASARFAVAGGIEDERAYLEFRVRPALQDLLDPQGGYTEGAEIQLFDLALRWYPESGQVRFQEAVLLDLVSLAPWDGLFRPLSYRFDTGLRTRLVSGDGHFLDPSAVWRTRGGGGLSARVLGTGLVYALAEGVLDVGPALGPDVALGAGGRAGLLVGTPGDRWRADLFAESVRFFAGDTTTWLVTGVDQRVSLSRNTALRLGTHYNRDFGEGWLEAWLRLDLFF